MIEYLNGTLTGKSPAHVVIDINGIGYWVNVSLNTYTSVSDKEQVKLFIHEAIREDAHILYGFFHRDERELFRMLISVSGVGANTGILFLSSLHPEEIKKAIVTGDVDRLKSIKGVGLKTAQRIVVELKDKLSKEPVSSDIFSVANNTARIEALSALETLGFARKNAEKIIDGILKKNPEKTVEEIIKDALRQM
jgi:holliday junction DNA helicase RuvA